MVHLCMRSVHCHTAAIREQWSPKLVLALKEAKNRKRVVLSIERIIKVLDKCGFGMVNSGISVIQTFCLSKPLDFWNWPKGFG